MSFKAIQVITAMFLVVLSGIFLIYTGLFQSFIEKYCLNKAKMQNAKNSIKSLKYFNYKRFYSYILQKKKLLFKLYIRNFIAFMIFLILVGTQIFLINLFQMIYKKPITSNNTYVENICFYLDSIYFNEEIMYNLMAFLMFTALIFVSPSRRFSNYIHKKYERFLNSKCYNEKLKKAKSQRSKDIIEYVQKLNDCESCFYKTRHHWLYRALCWLMCCSCCTINESNPHPCWYDCICVPLRQTTCCKKAIFTEKCLNILCCCKLWRYFYKKVKGDEQQQNNKNETENKSKRKLQNKWKKINELEADELAESSYKSVLKWVVPILPFSTHNKWQTISIYVIYTYDILTIFMYLYSSYFVMSIWPVIQEKKGVLIDFLLQIIQVISMGFKFYPLLAISDSDCGIVISILAFIYALIILVIKTINKSFCSKNETFLKFAIDKINENIEKSRIERIKSRFNASGIFDGKLETDEFKYNQAIQFGIPSQFENLFKQADVNELEYFNRIETNENSDIYSFGAGNNQVSNYAVTSTTVSTLSKPFGFRKIVNNRTNMYVYDLIKQSKGLYDNTYESLLRNLLENLPLYLSLAYLVTNYLLMLVNTIIDKISTKYLSTNPRDRSDSTSGLNEEAKSNRKSHDVLKKYLKNKYTVPSIEIECNRCYDKYSLNEKFYKNTNYVAIRYLIENLNDSTIAYRLNKASSPASTPASGIENIASNTVESVDNRYKYYKYSKHFLNTYTVAFMVIYFFTIFVLRMSNVFGMTLITVIEYIYRIIFVNISKRMNMQDMNVLNINVFNEFKIASLLASLICFIQLVRSIYSFRKRVINLNKGLNHVKYLSIDKKTTSEEKRRHNYNTIAAQSLHFNGYLIAYLAYGYILILCILFIIILAFKIIFTFPFIFDKSIQLFLPVIVMVCLNFIIIKFIIRLAFMNQKSAMSSYRIQNLTLYFTISYFNFFFDCFLGFMACLNRIWQTTLLSVFYVSRLDVSIFDEKNDIIMRHLDKGHLAYISFAYMEHLYNNQVLNGFCEIMVEALLNSLIKEELYKRMSENRGKYCTCPPLNASDEASNLVTVQPQSYNNSSQTHEFKYESFRRLSNIIHLYYVLKKYPKLRDYHKPKIVHQERPSFLRSFSSESRLSQSSRVHKQQQYQSIHDLHLIHSLNKHARLIHHTNLIKKYEQSSVKFQLQNFTLYALNEIYIIEFLKKYKNEIKLMIDDLKPIIPFKNDEYNLQKEIYLKSIRLHVKPRDDAYLSELINCFDLYKFNSNHDNIWDMFSMCFMGNNTIASMFRFLTTCILIALKYDIYHEIENYLKERNNQIDQVTSNKFKQINLIYLELLHASRTSNMQSSQIDKNNYFFLLLISTILNRKIIIYSNKQSVQKKVQFNQIEIVPIKDVNDDQLQLQFIQNTSDNLLNCMYLYINDKEFYFLEPNRASIQFLCK